jgi:hypothetical protein
MEVAMSRFRSAVPFATAFLSAALSFLVARPSPTDAGPDPSTPPAARAGEVSFDASLVRDGERLAVRIQGRNDAARDRSCSVRASLMRTAGDPRSRVAAMPVAIWTGAVAMHVPAKGEAVREVPVPAGVAAGIDAPGVRRAREVAESLDVLLQPDCTSPAGVG